MHQAEVFSPEKQEQILRGAACVFAKDGYEGASMSRIAAEAGVSKGTLYNYFAGKAELFAAWVKLECERKLTHIFAVEDRQGEADAVLREIGLRILRMMLSATGLTIYRMAVAEVHKFPALARVFHDAGPARAISQLAGYLAQQTECGRLHVPDPAFAAEQFFALAQTRLGMLRRFGMLTDPSDAAMRHVVDAAVTMFLGTYGGER